jgi:phage terminase small subunit
MGRPRKPTSLLILNGSIDHDKKRYANRTLEPKPEGKLGTVPKYFSEDLKDIWRELTKQVPDGVLTGADRIILELTCRLTAKMREGSISTGETAQLISCLSRLGLTPADRSKVNINPDDANRLVPESKFAKFA